VPRFLHSHGILQVIPSYLTASGQPWALLEGVKVILYPYIEGHNAIDKKMTPKQWVEFGRIMRRFHATRIPPTIATEVRRERFSPKWRRQVISHLQKIDAAPYKEAVARQSAAFLGVKREETLAIVGRAEALAAELQANQPEFMLCHGDIHGWNILIASSGSLYLVDWDTLVFAPKERDLMFIGGGFGKSGYTILEEESLFYRGYGGTQVDKVALAYYRYERIIEDIAVICNHIFSTNSSSPDREQAFGSLTSNYLPGSTIELARETDLRSRNR
jgi:spectinomycin phosphotransferase